MAHTQEINNARFNAEAAAWDSNLGHRHCSELALEAIKARVPGTTTEVHDTKSGLDVLEIGCGTGLLSLMIAPYVKTLIGVDTASGMVEAFQAKISQLQSMRDPLASRLAAICLLLEDPDDPQLQKVAQSLHKDEKPPFRFDLITSHLTLHHIPSLPSILKTMMGCLKSGGMIALTDFEDFGEDAVLFHPESKREGVERHGIKKAEMETLMKDVGFVDVKVERAFSMKKEIERSTDNKEKMDFPFLLCSGKKP